MSIEKVQKLFYPGYDGSGFYRIPALVKTLNGTVIAGADKRITNQEDWGDINAVIRRRPQGATEFDDNITVIDLPAGDDNDYAFLIDMSLLVQKQGKHKGRIHLLIDMFREGGNFWSAKNGSGFLNIDGKMYQALYDEFGHCYSIRENGVVYDAFGNQTLYKVQLEDEMPFTNLGLLSHQDKVLGNVFLKNSPLKTYQTSNIWYTYSDDDGLTWELPRNITGEVKAEWMRFLGTGPGVGLELQNGRLVFPVYFTDTLTNHQSTATVYSDDAGETWQRGSSPNDTKTTISAVGDIKQEVSEAQLVQLNNGATLVFMRNYSDKVKYAISYDNAKTWEDELLDLDFECEAYCQLSVLHFEREGKEYIIVSNPHGPDRTNGSVKLCIVHDERNIECISEKFINDTRYQYSCLTQLDEDNFALLYEEDDKDGKVNLKYVEFDWDWIIK